MRIPLSSMILLCFFLANDLFAQNQIFQTENVSVSKAVLLGKSVPLKDIKTTKIDLSLSKKASKKIKNGIPNFDKSVLMPRLNAANALPKGRDPLADAQVRSGGEPIELMTNVDGISFEESNIYPPDPNGDIGLNYYIQTVNISGGTGYKVFDKEGNVVQEVNNLNNLWMQFGKSGFGDPVILFDQDAARWVITEFAPFGSNTMLVAVSETDDPLGSYFAYEFITPNFPDYPKYGMWNDGYYVTTNEPSELSIPVYVLDREAMLIGASEATMVRLTDVSKFNSSEPSTFQVATPADWDGNTEPPANAPHYTLRLYDDAWEGGVDKIEIWKTYVDFNNPNDSYMEGPEEIELSPFESSLCQSSIFDCLDQPGNASVFAGQQILMRRVQYRNFGSYEAMVLAFAVDVDPSVNQAGMRWVEIRKEAGQDWSLYQEGTYAPDSLSRFMGTIAMDGQGNIALGYSVVDPDTYLGLRVTGRCASDPLGQMTAEETEIIPGFGENFTSRWGDYSSMTVDPNDEKTFWYTGEYMGEASWKTRIAKFQLNRDTIDVGPFSFISPDNSAYLTDTENVTVEIKNYGLEDQSNFNIGLIFEDALMVEDFFEDTIKVDEVIEHTFSVPVDMDAIKTYDFKIYTDLEADENVLNDTLRIQRTKLARYDLAVTSITGLESANCEDTLRVFATITNQGVEGINAFNVDFDLNGTVISNSMFVGDFPSGKDSVFALDLFDFNDGSNTIEVTVSITEPEGDEAPENDVRSADFDFSYALEKLNLQLTTDFNGFETTWEIWDDTGEILFEGGPYDFGGVSINEHWCLEEECYSFHLYDTGGNGWLFPNPDLGTPNYTIRGSDSIIVATLQNQNFGFLDEVDFCLPYECILDVSVNFEVVSEPGADDGIIALLAQNALPPIQYSIDGGGNYQSGSVFAGLSEGEYLISIVDARGCEAVDTFFLTGFSSVDPILYKTEVQVLPNPVTDLFYINVKGVSDLNFLEFQFVDLQGKVIQTNRLANYNGVLTGQFTLNGHPDGMYFIRFKDIRLPTLHKVIK